LAEITHLLEGVFKPAVIGNGLCEKASLRLGSLLFFLCSGSLALWSAPSAISLKEGKRETGQISWIRLFLVKHGHPSLSLFLRKPLGRNRLFCVLFQDQRRQFRSTLLSSFCSSIHALTPFSVSKFLISVLRSLRALPYRTCRKRGTGQISRVAYLSICCLACSPASGKREKGRLWRIETPDAEQPDQTEESIPILPLIVTAAPLTFSGTRPTTRAHGSRKTRGRYLTCPLIPAHTKERIVLYEVGSQISYNPHVAFRIETSNGCAATRGDADRLNCSLAIFLARFVTGAVPAKHGDSYPSDPIARIDIKLSDVYAAGPNGDSHGHRQLRNRYLTCTFITAHNTRTCPMGQVLVRSGFRTENWFQA